MLCANCCLVLAVFLLTSQLDLFLQLEISHQQFRQSLKPAIRQFDALIIGGIIDTLRHLGQHFPIHHNKYIIVDVPKVSNIEQIHILPETTLPYL